MEEELNIPDLDDELDESELDPLVTYRRGYLEGYSDGVDDGRTQGQEAALFRIRMAFKDNYDPDVREIMEKLGSELGNT